MTTPETWMPEARQMAAQCWCDDETKNTVMDVVLAEAIAKRIAAWMDTAAQAQRNCDYYRGLVVRCGVALGEAAKTCDDGSKSEDVLCAKVPELVEALVANDQISRERSELAEWSGSAMLEGYYAMRTENRQSYFLGEDGWIKATPPCTVNAKVYPCSQAAMKAAETTGGGGDITAVPSYLDPQPNDKVERP